MQKLLSNCKVPDVSRHRKRTNGDFRNLSQLLHNGEGKRTCRNLTLEFCSAEELAATPPLDSWILETLGLQDENTVDPKCSFNTPSFSCPLPTEDPYSTTNVDNAVGFSPNAETRCEYSSIVDSSSNCSLDTSSGYSTSQSLRSDYSTLDPLSSLHHHMYRVTGQLSISNDHRATLHTPTSRLHSISSPGRKPWSILQHTSLWFLQSTRGRQSTFLNTSYVP